MAEYKCPKCGGTRFDTDEVTMTGGWFSKFFNIQTKRFTAVSCRNCGYTELYRGSTDTLENVIDFFGN